MAATKVEGRFSGQDGAHCGGRIWRLPVQCRIPRVPDVNCGVIGCERGKMILLDKAARGMTQQNAHTAGPCPSCRLAVAAPAAPDSSRSSNHQVNGWRLSSSGRRGAVPAGGFHWK
jgi:hypothetical protein